MPFNHEKNLNSTESDSEPGDPKDGNHEQRRELRIGPLSNIDNAKIFCECGCGGCPDVVDPLADATDDGDRTERWAIKECEQAQAVSVERAREINRVYQHAKWIAENRTSGYERHRSQLYPRILSADRYFRSKWEGLTTAMMTRRIEAANEDGEYDDPYTLDAVLHTPGVKDKMRKSLNYGLRGFDFERVRVTAPTESAATPHEHWYLWIHDPEDEVTVEQIKPALDKHIKYVPAASYDNGQHPVDPEGQEGAITVKHQPPLVDQEPDKAEAIRDACEKMDNTDGRIRNTQGAQYLATQLAHNELGKAFGEMEDEPLGTLLEGSAIASATPSQWFAASQGVPDLGER